MRSILVSNVSHYHYLAKALHSAGLLHRYITAPALLDGEQAPGWLPAWWRKKLEGRRLRGVPGAYVRQIQLAEMVQRAAPASRLISRERGDWLNNHLFDALALRHLDACDVFHFVSSIGLYCARKARKGGAMIVCDVRQEHPAFQRRVLEEEASRFGVRTRITGGTYEAKVLEEFDLADFIIVPSAHARRTFVAEGFSPDRILTLPYGVNLDDFRPAAGARPEPFQILYSGSLTIRKGPQYLLEAVKGMGPGVKVILAGPLDPAFQPVLQRYAGSFEYVGVFPKLELRRLYAASSVFVLPSLADSFSLATLEAMACGLPVIVSENTGAADAFDDGTEGFVVPIRDAGAIREKIEYLRDNEDARAEMGRRAAARARVMTWERYGNQAIGLYHHMRSVHSGARSPAAVH